MCSSILPRHVLLLHPNNKRRSILFFTGKINKKKIHATELKMEFHSIFVWKRKLKSILCASTFFPFYSKCWSHYILFVLLLYILNVSTHIWVYTIVHGIYRYIRNLFAFLFIYFIPKKAILGYMEGYINGVKWKSE